MILHKGTLAFEDRLYAMEKNYLRSRYPGLVGYAYQSEMLSIEDGREIIEKILGDIITIDTNGPHGYESFKMFGEANNAVWHSIVDTDDFPQPSDEEEEDPPENPKRGPGKFSDDLDAAIYELSLDGGPDEEVGSSDNGFGWYGLMMAGDLEADLDAAGLKIDADERKFLRKQAGAIMHETGQGFVNVEWYEDDLELKQDWDSLVKEYEEEFADEEAG